jgi:hypothetical protein
VAASRVVAFLLTGGGKPLHHSSREGFKAFLKRLEYLISEINNIIRLGYQSGALTIMSPRNHVVITGTGRSGTTFLVELLTYLGLDTGFSAENIEAKRYHKIARAGLEHDIRREGCPFIVKNPQFCNYVEEVFHRDDIVIEHIFVPMRDLSAAAESRRYVTKSSVSALTFGERLKYMVRFKVFPGGLLDKGSDKPGKQEEELLTQMYKLMLAASDTAIPVSFMRYPRIVKDCPYLFEKLKPILPGITYESFSEVFNKTVRPDLVHSFTKNDY